MTVTPEQMQLLSEIFRIIVKEIRSDEDKEKLAPGEMGISYTEGSFYIRNPHTGELFSPNSTAFINQILSKYDPKTNKLNADLVSNIRVYSSINQLTQLGITLSADSIIRQMEYPGFLMASIEYSNYAIMGFPSDAGIMIVCKISPEFVYTIYFDSNTSNVYDGRYNRFKHMFDGWVLGSSVNNEYTETDGTGDHVTIRNEDELTDLKMFTVRVTNDIYPGADLSYNGGEAFPIIYADGSPLNSTISANNIIMLIYDDARKSWILVQSNESTVSASLDIVTNRMELVKKETDETLNEYKQSLNVMEENVKNLNQEIQTLKTRPGNIEAHVSTFTAETNDTKLIGPVEDFVVGVDKIIINYNQTILRPGIDYAFDESDQIQLLRFGLNAGDVLQFIVLKQVATDAEI